MLASRRAPREPSLHEIPRSFIAPHLQVSLTPHEAQIRLVLPGAHPRFTRENHTSFKRSKVKDNNVPHWILIFYHFGDNREELPNNDAFSAHFLGPVPT